MSNGAGIEWTSIDAPKGLPPRFRWIGLVVALLVVGGLVYFAVVEGDKIARDVARDVVKTGVVSALQLTDGSEVEVELGDGLLLAQAVTGSIDEVTITVPRVSFGAAVGTLRVEASGVPLDPRGPVDTLVATMLVDETNLVAYGPQLTGVPLTLLTMADADITIGADIGGVPVTVALAPSLNETGGVLFTPGAVTAGGVATTAPELLAGPLAPLAAPMLTSPGICVADYLPADFTLTSVAVVDKQLAVSAQGTGVRLSALGTKGTCEP